MLRHTSCREQERGAAWRENEVNLVLFHELGEETHAGVEVALIVVDRHLYGQLLAGHVETARSVDVLHPQLVGRAEVGLLEERVHAGDRTGRADADLVRSRGLWARRHCGPTAAGGGRRGGAAASGDQSTQTATNAHHGAGDPGVLQELTPANGLAFEQTFICGSG
jgi:hypothetical protein